MLDIKYIEENLEEVKKNLQKRGFDLSIIDQVINSNKKRKELIAIVESSRAEVKKLSKDIGELKKSGRDATELMNKVAASKKDVEDKNIELEKILEEQNYTLATIPNLIDDSVPEGNSDEDNKEIKSWGKIREFSFAPKEHADLGEELGMLDFETGAKLTGARFVAYKGGLAKLERALINFMLDDHEKYGYEEAIPPFIVHARSLFGTGQLPKFKEDLFKLEGHDWYLVPTAEVPLTNFKAGELFPMSELPIKYCAYTPCFRSEAGSHGKDTKGLIRLHQFNKVELVNIVAADQSEKAHQDMVDRACNILEQLELPYRAMLLCSKDIGFGARKCVDLEVWLPGQNKYREISSISNCWDFQARRAGIRYRNAEGKPEFAHTLNGSGLAVGRTLVAIMENYQNEDGSITIPKVLRPYMGGRELISKK